MVEQDMFVIRSPLWSTFIVNFDLHHCLDTVDDLRHFDFLLLLGWCLLLHCVSPDECLVSCGPKCQISRRQVRLQKRADKSHSGRSFLCTLRVLARVSDSDSVLD